MKKAPYIVLLVLFIVLVFIVGVRYGQRVEKANKIIDSILKLTPSPAPTQDMQEVQFKTFTHTGCGVSFLYPSYLSAQDESTTSATLTTQDADYVSVSCPTTQAKQIPLKAPNIATDEVAFQNKQLHVQKRVENGHTYVDLALTHPLTGRVVKISVDDSLLPLLDKSLTFSQPVRPTAVPAKTASPSAQ